MSTKRALLSVSDRSGLLDLANALLRHGFEQAQPEHGRRIAHGQHGVRAEIAER